MKIDDTVSSQKRADLLSSMMRAGSITTVGGAADLVKLKKPSFELLDLPKNPQAEMIARVILFQDKLGVWDDRCKDFGDDTFADPYKTLWMLDMAVQETADAWQLVSPGWKHQDPKPSPDVEDVLLELVDVAALMFAAYAYLGGQPEAEMVARAVSRAKEAIKIPRFGLDEVWGGAERTWQRRGPALASLYSHGKRSHGELWVKSAATRINYLRVSVHKISEGIRHGLSRLPADQREANSFPAASGFIYLEGVLWVVAAVQALPGVDQQMFYSAFVHKMNLNFERLDGRSDLLP